MASKKKADSPALWERFPAAEELAEQIRAAYHKHLEGLHILCFAKPEASKSKGQVNVAKARLGSSGVPTHGRNHWRARLAPPSTAT